VDAGLTVDALRIAVARAAPGAKQLLERGLARGDLTQAHAVQTLMLFHPVACRGVSLKSAQLFDALRADPSFRARNFEPPRRDYAEVVAHVFAAHDSAAGRISALGDWMDAQVHNHAARTMERNAQIDPSSPGVRVVVHGDMAECHARNAPHFWCDEIAARRERGDMRGGFHPNCVCEVLPAKYAPQNLAPVVNPARWRPWRPIDAADVPWPGEMVQELRDVVRMHDISPDALQRLSDLAAMPRSLQLELSRGLANGGGIILGDINAATALDTRRWEPPRGYPPGVGWDKNGGLYDPATNTLFAGAIRYGGGTNTVWHEAGHVFDRMRGKASDSPEWRRWGMELESAMDTDRYFNSNENPGWRSELYAETHAAWLKWRGTVSGDALAHRLSGAVFDYANGGTVRNDAEVERVTLAMVAYFESTL